MRLELIVAIIGAGAAIIGAFISTISIILTNKNTKMLHLLDNSKSVRKDIAEKRHIVYKELIDYINSFNYKLKLKTDYTTCPANKNLMIPYEHDIKSMQDIEKEYDKICALSINYLFLDRITYQIIILLELYFSIVINYAYTHSIENFLLFTHVILYDILKILEMLQKNIHKYFKNNNVLNYKTTNKISKNKMLLNLNNTNFYNIYLGPSKKAKQNESISKYKDEIINLTNYLKQFNDIDEDSSDKETIDHVNKIKIYIKTLKKFIKHPPRIKRSKKTKMFCMWKTCNQCNNINCILNKNYKL